MGFALLSDKEATFRETDMKNDPERNGIFLTKRSINGRAYEKHTIYNAQIVFLVFDAATAVILSSLSRI